MLWNYLSGNSSKNNKIQPGCREVNKELKVGTFMHHRANQNKMNRTKWNESTKNSSPNNKKSQDSAVILLDLPYIIVMSISFQISLDFTSHSLT